MLREVAIPGLVSDQVVEIQVAFAQAQMINTAMPRYIEHKLQKCVGNLSRHTAGTVEYVE